MTGVSAQHVSKRYFMHIRPDHAALQPFVPAIIIIIISSSSSSSGEAGNQLLPSDGRRLIALDTPAFKSASIRPFARCISSHSI